MRDAGIGRVLVAALHQGITDVLPDRVEFYENWLNPKGLRDGTIGLAPLLAVLSFLRTEGGAYSRVTARAGDYAGQWTVGELTELRRRFITSLPGPFRRRVALGVMRDLVAHAYTGSRSKVRMRRGVGALEIKSSIFCSVPIVQGIREKPDHPLCDFYAAAVTRVLACLDVHAHASVIGCQATGDPACHVQVRMGSAEANPEPDAALSGEPAA